MTVLKSLDLKGNKQSFAGWISNLSPCDTPFISMIGKESIDEVQYSWQMDALDTPKNAGFEEGSDAVPEKREPTHIVHNFTSILRKVAHVSDTVASISTHGRAKEMEYQLGKSGKELKRDMEYMCLNNEIGNIGTSAKASQSSGFIGLCAPRDYIDHSTGAKTFKEVNVANENGPWFKTSDLFDLTYNLFLAGSKANKIMYHPFHATTFSDFIGHSFEAKQTYRMFDNVDTKFNAQVNKIRDPLGQNYDLIPNRHMPRDKIYIFNESDWTQMILRAPSATKLAKKGSSERFLIETEVGLRHRHVNASGIMSMDPSTLLMTWTEEPSPLTWGVNHNEEAEITIKTRATDLPVAAGTSVSWSSSNTAVLVVVDSVGHTDAAGKATALLTPQKAGTSIVSVVCGDSRASYIVTVEDPKIRLTIASPQLEKKAKTLAAVQVLKADGTPVEDGIMVNFKANPSSLVTFASIQAPTENNTGVAEVEMTAENTLGLVQVQASVGDAVSNYVRVEIVEKVEILVMRIDRRAIAHDVNDSTTMGIEVVDSQGNPIVSQPVSITSTDTSVVNIAHNDIVTDGTTGVYSLVLTSAGAKGTTDIVAKYKKQEIVIRLTVADPDVVLGCPIDAQEGVEFQMSATVKRSDGSELEGVDVLFESTPAFNPLIPATKTTSDGLARASYTPMGNSDLEITASVGSTKSNVCNVTVAAKGIGVLKAPEVLTRPIAIGGKSQAKVVLSDKSGMPLRDKVVTWTVEPASVATAASATTMTDLNGMSLLELTGVGKGVASIAHACEGETSQVTSFHVGQGTTKAFFTSPVSPKINEVTAVTAIIRRNEDNAPVAGADVTFTTNVPVGGFPVTVKTDSQGVATFDNFFPDSGNFVITATCPEFSHSEVVNLVVQEPDTSYDTPYVMTSFGQHVKLTHDTLKTSTITIQCKLWGSVSPGIRMDVRSLDPHIAIASVVDTPTNSQGKYSFTVRGTGPGTARIQVKARNNAANWLDIPVQVGSPTLEVIVSPTTMSSGTTVEFAAVYKDCNGDWAPGMEIRWEHPKTMLNGQQTIPNAVTDQFGRTFYSNRGGAWATHTFRAILVSNDAIRSRDHSITVHM